MTQAFNLALLANNVNSSGQLSASTGLANATPVANGGTGVATIAANALVVGAGTSAVTTIAPGTNGNALVSNGTVWQSVAPPYSGSKGQFITTSTTFTVPSGVTALKVTVVGGGGGGGGASGGAGAGGGGGGGYAVKFLTGLTPGASISVTIGAGGTAGASTGGTGGNGGTTSFGAYCSATGGTGGVGSSGSGAGGTAGTGSGGDWNGTGVNGQPGDIYSGSWGGAGGGSSGAVTRGVSPYFDYGSGVGLFGGFGGAYAPATNVSYPATGYGNGGGGACAPGSSVAGGVGTAGCVLVEW